MPVASHYEHDLTLTPTLTLTLTPHPHPHPYPNPHQLPHYEHDNMKHQLEFTRKVASGSILMSKACKLKTNPNPNPNPNPHPNPNPNPNPNPSAWGSSMVRAGSPRMHPKCSHLACVCTLSLCVTTCSPFSCL